MIKTVLLGVVGASAVQPQGPFQQALDDMEQHFHGSNAHYDAAYFEKLTTCMASNGDTKLVRAQNAAWQGMADYYNSNGTDSDYMGRPDHWGGCQNFTADDRCNVPSYMDNQNPGMFGNSSSSLGEYLIFERCNYASNVAFYRSVTRICDYPNWSVDTEEQMAMKQNFASLAVGSSFWHGSHTYVGQEFDNNMIAIIAFQAHQLSLSGLRNASTMLMDLQAEPRSKSAKQTALEVTEMFYSNETKYWAEVMDKADIPHDYFITFAAIVTTGATLMLPRSLIEPVLVKVYKLVLSEDEASFMINDYLPAYNSAIAGVRISLFSKIELFFKFLGTLIKLIWAFLWQEHMLKLPFLWHPLPLRVGAFLTPGVNFLGTVLNDFAQTDRNVMTSSDVYPGDSFCRTDTPHALWHEQSSNGLLELVFLTDFIKSIVSN